jgi:hypothetical protein
MVMQMPLKRPSTVVLITLILLMSASGALSAQTLEETVASAVAFCRGYPRLQVRGYTDIDYRTPQPGGYSFHIKDDKTVLCYDGAIFDNQDISVMNDLVEGGIFVVRSSGGMPNTAIKMGNILKSKMATVVIHDYCMAACAIFLYIASDTTYVVRDSIVVWYAVRYRVPPCEDNTFSMSSAETKELWMSLSPERRERNCKDLADLVDFFKKRGGTLNSFFESQSPHIKKILQSANDQGLDTTGQYWMWHPRYHKDVFNTKIIYESYPKSQDDVDEITRRLGFPKMLYDP